MSGFDYVKDTTFDYELRDPNQTIEEWTAEILVKSKYERWQIPVECYAKNWSAQETIGHMEEMQANVRAPGRPRVARNAEYVKRRIADLIWQDCSKLLGQAYLLPDGRKVAIEMQIWAEQNGSRFKAK